ncbi:hypothetical protein MHZ92_00285 [Sporosarcina sp. ACRSL]|uniref:hypothetical protein n=1 Tax=Sporosarcina sp. ACRSL TaxID=2918215 RepID=UPI001EF5FF51|nr:hypothetical protein [Sporosarcina sp. ACRSL]MCG7342545.1 hypothetical protein [Sporosarcina sp. ACRSL]
MDKEEEVRMTLEESESYGRAINARNAAVERNQVYEEEEIIPALELPPPLSEEEIKKRVGEANYNYMKDEKTMNSINS